MKRLNIPLVLDTLFAAVCAFLLFFTFVRFYTKNVAAALIFGITGAILFGALGCVYISGKQKKHLLITSDEKKKKLLSLHLSLSSDAYIKNLLKSLLGEEAKIRGNCVICGGVDYFFNFKMQPLSEDDIAPVIKKKSENEKTLFLNRISPEALILSENFHIGIKDINEVYEKLKSGGLMPEKFLYEEPKKPNVFKRIKSKFNRKICAPLFWSGAALLALSYFTFFPVYYIVSGSIMLILSAVALFITA